MIIEYYYTLISKERTIITKKVKLAVSVVLLISCSFILKAGNIDLPYEVATWKGFRKAAITYTFDDGCPNQYTIAIPMFNTLKLNATYFIVTTWKPKWPVLKLAAEEGQEVASHTVTHPNLGTISASAQKTELMNSYDTIQSCIPGLHGMTMAYPYCARGIDSITSDYYFAARGCQGFIEKSTPGDFLNISSVICGKLGAVKTTADFKNKDEAADSSGGWCVYLIHGIDNDGGYSPLPSDVLRENLEYLNANPDKYWVETFGNVVRYIRERNNLSVKELKATVSTINIKVGDTLPDDIYNYPITIRRSLQSGWKYVTGSQNGRVINIKVITLDSRQFIQFDAVPDKGEVILSKKNAPVN